MLITQLKSKETIASLVSGKVFIINCHGCKEILFPEQEAKALQKEMALSGEVTGVMTVDYICQPDNLKLRLENYKEELAEADMVLVFSCGVGVQTVAGLMPEKKVCAGCDTYRLPGFQGVTPLEHDCGQCGECYLNLTGGICPITACSKSLLNGQCGGAKDGRCEVNPNMRCGWQRIQERLEKIGRLDALKSPVQVRNYATDDVVKEMRQSENK